MDFLNGSFRVGRIAGINIRVHVLWVLYIAFQMFEAGRAWRSEALFFGLLFGIVLLHEFGHCFGARAVGGDARDILMWPLGGLAYAAAPMRPWPQFVTVAAGPFVNVLFCVVSGTILGVVAWQMYELSPLRLFALNPFVGIRGYFDVPWLNLLSTFYRVNYFLLAFNLLPIYPLDGGQLFHAIIWPFFGLQRATRIACTVGIIGAAMLGVWGISGGGGGMLIFIAMFGGFECLRRLRMANAGMIIEDDRFTTYDRSGRFARRPGFWSRLFRRRGGQDSVGPVEYPSGRVSQNPNPGAWEARMAERDNIEAELDRILKKVSERGIHSLTYVERQTLERATRARQAEERDFERRTRP